MANDKSTIQVIMENVRDAGVNFGKRFTPPSANVLAEVRKLLTELGIKDPDGSVSSALEGVAADWKNISYSLSAISLDFTNPGEVIAGIDKKISVIKSAFTDILNKPGEALNGLLASGIAIKTVFPKRLLDYIVYEFITKSHEKIGGVFLLLGVLRRERQETGGNQALIADAEIRIFDLPQLIKMITHPKETFLIVMRWGKNDFLARPIVDGMTLLLGTIAKRGPENGVLALSEEAKFVGPLDADIKESALRTLTTPTGTLSFVGLHKHGLGLMVPNPVKVGGNIIPAPPLAAVQIFALTPGNIPESDPPGFRILP